MRVTSQSLIQTLKNFACFFDVHFEKGSSTTGFQVTALYLLRPVEDNLSTASAAQVSMKTYQEVLF